MMKRVLIVLFVLLFPLSSLACNVDIRDIRWVSADDLALSLKGRPKMAVGFDVDETVLFTSPSFNHVANVRCGGDLNACMKTKEFWSDANVLDSFNLQKKVGMELVKMHLKRGDTVYFITARPPTEKETLTDLLRAYLNAPNLPPVIFTGFVQGQNLKIAPITKLKLSMFYGDADSDVTAALAAHARPIRMLRAKNTLDTFPACPGEYNEEVVVGSDV